MSDAASAIRDRLNGDLVSAMKSRDSIEIAALRSLMSALDNASAVPTDKSNTSNFGRVDDVPRKTLSVEECENVLAGEARNRSTAAEEYERLGRHREAARLRAELAVIERYANEPL